MPAAQKRFPLPLYPFEDSLMKPILIRHFDRHWHVIKDRLRQLDETEHSDVAKSLRRRHFDRFEACLANGECPDEELFVVIRASFNSVRSYLVQRQRNIFGIFAHIVNQKPGLHNFDKRPLGKPSDLKFNLNTTKTRLLIVSGLVKGVWERDLDNANMELEKEQATAANENPEPEEVLLNLVLLITQALFRCRETLPEKTYNSALEKGKDVLRKSERNVEIRQNLSRKLEMWKEIADVFVKAIPVLEAQSFASDDPGNSNYCNGSSSTLMALNHATLMKDLERVNDILMIARNMLASTSRAQDFAADAELDAMVLRLMDICVRVTARGYDGGEAGTRNEQQWANIVGSYKKLLITCLQFLHNFVMYNEKRKLLLWLDLFGNSRTADQQFKGELDPRKDSSLRPIGGPKGIIQDRLALYTMGTSQSTEEFDAALDSLDKSRRQAVDLPKDEVARLATQVLQTVDGLVNMTLRQGPRAKSHSDGLQPNGEELPTTDRSASDPLAVSNKSFGWDRLSGATIYRDPRNGPIQQEDMKMAKTPESAAKTLQLAKDQLMARLHDAPQPAEADQQGAYAGAEQDEDAHDSDEADNGSVDDEDGHNEEEDEDGYPAAGDQERGLLTDIPLVLGPQEIEALPMIIKAGIVPNEQSKKAEAGEDVQDMQGVRCNILLAQEAGRNLLRELLIFVAAWDLQEDEFYFKMMMQIMEAILDNGLMPYAYQAFGEVKDIVSPAQSMVIKLLTQIFRAKQGLTPATSGTAATAPSFRRENATRVELLVVRYIFSIFRQAIIPETCALIYLQGQIREGAALPEDFPLNMWDMERVYEGVYQFLEFFAVLTECEDWKSLLVKWEIVSELVTLLRELEGSIPKAPLGPLPQTTAEAAAAAAISQPLQNTGPGNTASAGPTPVAVERPYEPIAGDISFPPNPYNDLSAPSSPSATANVPLDSAEPSEFEWRNLKKLVVLVLSSLVWKSSTVQNQIRDYGGVEMVLACCNFDGNNPYIKEHAIMCLRFLLEGNRENQDVVGRLEARKGADGGSGAGKK